MDKSLIFTFLIIIAIILLFFVIGYLIKINIVNTNNKKNESIDENNDENNDEIVKKMYDNIFK